MDDEKRREGKKRDEPMDEELRGAYHFLLGMRLLQDEMKAWEAYCQAGSPFGETLAGFDVWDRFGWIARGN